MTLQEFSDKVIKPMLINSIESGRLDDIILEEDCFEIIVKDKELLEAARKRINAIIKT